MLFDAEIDYRANAGRAPVAAGGNARLAIMTQSRINQYAPRARGPSKTVRPCDSISDLNFSRECS